MNQLYPDKLSVYFVPSCHGDQDGVHTVYLFFRNPCIELLKFLCDNDFMAGCTNWPDIKNDQLSIGYSELTDPEFELFLTQMKIGDDFTDTKAMEGSIIRNNMFDRLEICGSNSSQILNQNAILNSKIIQESYLTIKTVTVYTSMINQILQVHSCLTHLTFDNCEFIVDSPISVPNSCLLKSLTFSIHPDSPLINEIYKCID